MNKKLPFIQKAAPPPDVGEGDILKTTIQKIERETGEYGEQLRFDCSLVDGFKAKAWISYYDAPTDRSKLGKLMMKLADKTDIVYETLPEAIKALQAYGSIYLKVNGFREWEDQVFPKFTIVADKLPPKQTEKKETAKTVPLLGEKEAKPKLTMEEAKTLTAALPEQAREDYLNYLRDTGQLQENL